MTEAAYNDDDDEGIHEGVEWYFSSEINLYILVIRHKFLRKTYWKLKEMLPISPNYVTVLDLMFNLCSISIAYKLNITAPWDYHDKE